MIEIEITEEMKSRALDKATEMGKLNHSITAGQGNLAGFIGEEVANEIIKGSISNTYDYDIIEEQGSRWDIKTKRCTSAPRDYYECSVAAYNTKQRCDYYAFVRVEYKNGEWGRAWFLGAYNKSDYFNDATFLKKGQIDPSNNFTVKADCYNMPINKLKYRDGMTEYYYLKKDELYDV